MEGRQRRLASGTEYGIPTMSPADYSGARRWQGTLQGWEVAPSQEQRGPGATQVQLSSRGRSGWARLPTFDADWPCRWRACGVAKLVHLHTALSIVLAQHLHKSAGQAMPDRAVPPRRHQGQLQPRAARWPSPAAVPRHLRAECGEAKGDLDAASAALPSARSLHVQPSCPPPSRPTRPDATQPSHSVAHGQRYTGRAGRVVGAQASCR
eukprot:scaffold225318_cov37-Tisochrysis_lutea.AAC.1